MPTTTTTYSFNKPVVGADEDDWGGYLNGNWDSVDDLLDGTTPVTGIDINSGTLDGVTIGGTTAGAGTFTTLTANTSITGTLATAAQPNVTSLGTLTGLTVSGDVSFGDSDKAIFGAGSDLQIKHTGTHAYISNTTGNTYLQGGGQFRVQSASGENHFIANADGAVNLYYDNTLKLATTSTGVDITGTLTSDGLTVQTTNGLNAVIEGTTSYQYLQFKNSGETENYLGFVNDRFTVTAGNTQYLQVEGNGDISFYEDTGTTAKFFWDASAESLGIGTSSPAAPLEVSTSSADYRIQLTHTSGQNKIKSLDGDQSTFRNLSFDAAQHMFETSGTERMRIDSSGNVGIGTSSPDKLVHLKTSVSNTAVLRIESTATDSYPFLSLKNDAREYQLTAHGPLGDVFTIYDGTAGSHRFVIDSSGNLLVGKTSLDFGATAGQEFRADGRVFIGHAGAGHFVNRIGSDGTIAEFRKDGTTVGSIGTLTDDLSIGNLDTGLIFQGAGDRISPFNPATNTYRDAAIDLGYTTRRFKDLYLSGGVFLGGTGSSNKLDDYEEGTFTPVLKFGASDAGITYTNREGLYTKVGRLVTCFIRIGLTNNGTSTGVAVIDDLPFTVGDVLGSTSVQGGAPMTFVSGVSGTQYGFHVHPWENTTTLEIYRISNTSGLSGATEATEANLSNSFDCRITVTYMTA